MFYGRAKRSALNALNLLNFNTKTQPQKVELTRPFDASDANRHPSLRRDLAHTVAEAHAMNSLRQGQVRSSQITGVEAFCIAILADMPTST